MSNIHSLSSYDKKQGGGDNDDDDNDNSRYVGGVNARGGGSGLAVEPSWDEQQQQRQPPQIPLPGAASDSIFRLAEQQQHLDDDEDDDDEFDPNTSNVSGQQQQRRITMYRNGFVVDDGPYRRLDDPANAEFLRSLAMGRTPRELMTENENGTVNQNVMVALVDKRQEDYVQPPPQFQSFSGAGQSLGSRSTTSATGATATATSGRLDPAELLSVAAAAAAPTNGAPTTRIQVRSATGQRFVVTIALTATIVDLAREIVLLQQQQQQQPNNDAFVLQAGYPPHTLTDLQQTIAEAKLQGAQVVQKRVE